MTTPAEAFEALARAALPGVEPLEVRVRVRDDGLPHELRLPDLFANGDTTDYTFFDETDLRRILIAVARKRHVRFVRIAEHRANRLVAGEADARAQAAALATLEGSAP